MREAHALGRLGAQGAGGLADVIRETHRAIGARAFRAAPGGAAAGAVHDGISAVVYGAVRAGTAAAAYGGGAYAAARAGSLTASARGRLLVGAVNGAWGDMLAAQGSRLHAARAALQHGAARHRQRQATGRAARGRLRPLARRRRRHHADRPLHGRPRRAHGVPLGPRARPALGAARAARHLARVAAQRADLEKAAHVAGVALGRLPETRALGAALNRRSAGIKDLRDGIRDLPWLETAQHTFIAASLFADPDHPVGRWMGDLLVRRSSAWAGGQHGEEEHFKLESSHCIGPANHFTLLNHPGVYEQIDRVLRAERGLPVAGLYSGSS